MANAAQIMDEELDAGAGVLNMNQILILPLNLNEKLILHLTVLITAVMNQNILWIPLLMKRTLQIVAYKFINRIDQIYKNLYLEIRSINVHFRVDLFACKHILIY